jgi:hypothetical protein
MIKVLFFILMTVTIVEAQDSIFVKEFCENLVRSVDGRDVVDGVRESNEIIDRYIARDSVRFFEAFDDPNRFQYRLWRELMKNCPNFKPERIRIFHPRLVLDFERILATSEVDSLSILISKLNDEKNVYLYIVTIDDYYPDSSITDFSNRYREYWVPRKPSEKGEVVIVLSKNRRGIRVSTGDSSMIHLTDEECSAANQRMIPHFKSGNFFDGLVAGVLAIGSML